MNKMKKKQKGFVIAAGIVVLASLIACIVITALSGTATFGRDRILCIALFGGAGWIALTFWFFFADRYKREISHAETIFSMPEEVFTGKTTLTRDWVLIPHSITIRKVIVETEEGRKVLNLNSRFVKRFPKGPKMLKLYTVSGYIKGFEEVPS